MGRDHPYIVYGRPCLFWIDLFAYCHEWRWAGNGIGNYIRIDTVDILGEFDIINTIFNIIKMEKMRLFFSQKK